MLAIVDGFPAGMKIDDESINSDLALRQGGYGRGARQKLETDKIEFLSGVWKETTLGSPIAMQVINRDYKLERLKDLEFPRPGHGDLTGAIKYLGTVRGILERASARETSVRVAAGSLAKQLLSHFGIRAIGYVTQIGPLVLPPEPGTFEEQVAKRNNSIVYSLAPGMDDQAKKLIDETKEKQDTVGGIIEVRIEGVPFGLGTHAQWDRKLDGKIAHAVMAVQAIKGVEIGMGFDAARRYGSEVHDPIQYDESQKNTSTLGYVRPSNNAGGLEAGMTNGQPIIVRAAKKPISTLMNRLESINMETKEPGKATYERSDVCAISAASIIIECVVAFEVANAFVEKFGGDSIQEMDSRLKQFLELAKER